MSGSECGRFKVWKSYKNEQLIILNLWTLAKLQSNLKSKRFSYSTYRYKYCTRQTCINCRFRFIFLFCMWPGVMTCVEVSAEFICWPLLPSCDREAAAAVVAAASALSSSQHLRSFYIHQKFHDCWPTCSCHLVAVGYKFEDSLMVQCRLLFFFLMNISRHLTNQSVSFHKRIPICRINSCNISTLIFLLVKNRFFYVAGINSSPSLLSVPPVTAHQLVCV